MFGSFLYFFALICLIRVNATQLRGLNSESEFWTEFTEFQEKFFKKYESLEILRLRYKNFRTNLKEIIAHNLNNTETFTMGINAFSDLSHDEFKMLYTSSFTSGKKDQCVRFSSSGKSLVDSVDWREKGAVSPVKNQGQCGSCWSFSATGAMEGAWAISKGHLISLSEQQLVDCSSSYGNMACNGGLMDSAFSYAIDNSMCSESSYSYNAVKGTCQTCDPVVKVVGCVDVTANNQQALKEAVSYGPVSVAIEADTRVFQSYSSGIVTSTKCGTKLDHGVLVVGYGLESGVEYWIVKNSWGPEWGDKGYVRIGRSDSENDKGICGIAMQPSFPVV
jgi:C1A family cysteine protease